MYELHGFQLGHEYWGKIQKAPNVVEDVARHTVKEDLAYVLTVI